jgi:hypothetical protein
MSRELQEGERIGRFVVVRDLDGHVHAVAAGSVGAICATDEGALLLLPGGRLIHLGRPLSVVLAWLDGRGTAS